MNEPFSLPEHVAESIAARGLFARGESVLVAVSGGMDSMVLLHLMARLASANGWCLTVAHFNHRLRGRSSGADERVVKRTAEKLGLAFVSGRADVREFAREQKLSLEMAARKLRHEFLARAAKQRRIRKLALAHHADDQVELFFVRLLRGAGGEGLAGMKWLGPSPMDARLRLARPLLDQPKSALAEYAERERVPFREDATNAQLNIQRNRIRHEVLPLLTKKYQPALARVVLRQMEIVGAEAEWVTEGAREWVRKALVSPPPHVGGYEDFEALPVALQRRVLQLQLVEMGVAATFDLIEQLRETANRPVTVNAELAVLRELSGRVSVHESGNSDFGEATKRLRLEGGAGEIEFGGVAISWELEPAPGGTFRARKKKVNCECLDADKVGIGMILRHWQPGDRFQPLGMAAPVKLQDLFTNEKIPRALRRRLVIGATAKGELFWVEGLRLGEGFKLDKKTRYQLKWRWKRL